MIDSEKKYWIWMASLPGIGPKTFYYILKEFGSAQGLFEAAQPGSQLLERIPAEVLAAVKSACSAQRVNEQLAELTQKGISAVTRIDEDYPKPLLSITYPPPVLFVRGSIENVFKQGLCISIVGTRRCSRKGYELTYKIAKELAEAGVTVISGMARGIDSAAHTGALDGGGKTIAVLGCGADVIYPPECDDIYERTVNNGAVISELAPGSAPLAENFPARNRIIAALSQGTLVVESDESGGTAITASLAISMGRDIFAVPGPPHMAVSALPNLLISEGAKSVCSAKDVLKFYNVAAEEAAGDPMTGNLQLDFLQRQIYNLLLQGDAGAENLANSIEYPQSEINAALTMMELGGLIKRLPGGKYGV